MRKEKKRLVYLYTRINGVEKVQTLPPRGLDINKDFYESLGIKTSTSMEEGWKAHTI
jgi:hypothetical protein